MRGRVTVVVDNHSWIVPYAEQLVLRARSLGFEAIFAGSYDAMNGGDIAFCLGCTKIARESTLAKNKWNLVVHESALPLGRGFAPIAWQVINGARSIPVVLMQADVGADTGPIVEQDEIKLTGYELCDELRRMQGEMTIVLCERFLEKHPDCPLQPQIGEPTYFRRRTPEDSRLDPDRTIRDQFNLLRTVDNDRYPAFFEIDGHRYQIQISRVRGLA